LRGSSGYILVADGTRLETLDRAIALQREAEKVLDKAPFVLMMNKLDRSDDWAIEDEAVESLMDQGWPIFRSSAKTGQGVEEAFTSLAMQVCDAENPHLAARGN
jgi:hypothetical protein